MSFALVSYTSAAPESTQLFMINFFQEKISTRNNPRIPKLQSSEALDIKPGMDTSKYSSSWREKAENKITVPEFRKVKNFG